MILETVRKRVLGLFFPSAIALQALDFYEVRVDKTVVEIPLVFISNKFTTYF